MAKAYYPKDGSFVAWTPDMVGALGAKTANGYEGMTTSASNDSDWIRTTSAGIIPYKAGGASALGTSGWPFNTAYITSVHGNADTATKATYIKDSTDGGNISVTYAKAGQSSTSWLASWNGKELGSISPSRITAGNATNAYNLSWSGNNIVGDVSPIGTALSAEHSANRLAFIKGEALTFEYSSDGGTTYTDCGLSNTAKSQFCTTQYSIPVGRKDNTTDYTTNSRLRVTLSAQGYVYTNPRKLLINVSSSGGMKVIIEYKTGVSGAAWQTFGEYPVSGWSGWNDIPLILGTIGGGSTQTSNNWYLRLTFVMTSVNSSFPKQATVEGIRLFGINNWQSASETAGKGKMSSTGHIYSYDMDANTTFPAQVTATRFNGALNGKASTAGTADSANSVAYENVTNIGSHVYDATASRTKNTVLAAPNGSNGVASFRTLVAADIPALSYVPTTEAGTDAALNRLSTGSSTPVDADYYISQYANGGTTTTTYHRRPMSALWSYIKGKADNIYQAKGSYAAASHTHNNGKVTAETGKVSIATSGLSMSQAYANGWPKTYGNTLNMCGSGMGQIFVEWSGNGTEPGYSSMHYRARTDGGANSWSEWYQVYDTGHKPTKSDVGLPNVENKSSATIRGELTKANVTTALGYTPPTTNTDTKVTQTATSTDAAYPLLLAPSGQTATATTTSYFDSGVTLNPSTNTIAASISGTAARATKLAATQKGSSTNPVYISSDGVPTACTYSLNKTVPSTAVFTDTKTVVASSTQPTDSNVMIWIKTS